ncbi:hypothetical protein ACCC98_24320 [Rhizobium pisi]
MRHKGNAKTLFILRKRDGPDEDAGITDRHIFRQVQGCGGILAAHEIELPCLVEGRKRRISGIACSEYNFLRIGRVAVVENGADPEKQPFIIFSEEPTGQKLRPKPMIQLIPEIGNFTESEHFHRDPPISKPALNVRTSKFHQL